MYRVYFGNFLNFTYWDSSGFFFPYSGQIEDTKSVEFASVAINSTLTPKMTGLSSEDAVWPSSVKDRMSTADSTLVVGRGLSRMSIVAAAT